MVCYSHLLKNLSQFVVIQAVKGFGVVNKAEVDVFLGEGNGTPTAVLLPGKSHGPTALVGCGPWGHQESDTTEQLHFCFSLSGRKWQLTPVFLPGESQGRGNLVGCRLWGHTESDMTEVS